MYNYYVYNPSYDNVTTKALEANLQNLQSLFADRNENEFFLKHDSIWDINLQDGLFAKVVFSDFEDKQFAIQVLPHLFQQIKSIDSEINSIEEFNNRYRIYNAFYGINFHDLPIEYCINNLVSYNSFVETNMWNLTPQIFWKRKEELFNKIIFCSNVERQLKSIGGTYLEQITNKIRELDNFVVHYWNKGSFSYKNANNNSALVITPESDSTMNDKELVNMRTFKLPDGRIECFELHIKTGNLRFHFYPDDFNIYIGYIGVHLPTAKC